MSLTYCLPLVLPIAKTHNRWLIVLIIGLHTTAAVLVGYVLDGLWQVGLLGAITASAVWEIIQLRRLGRPIKLSIDAKNRTELHLHHAGKDTTLPVKIQDYWRIGRLLILRLNTPKGICRLYLYPPQNSKQAHRLRAWLHGRFYLKVEE